MKVFLKPADSMSRAMFRVADALSLYGPEGVEVVDDIEHADLVVLHVIGADVFEYVKSLDKPFAVIQYCYQSAGGTLEQWKELWAKAVAVWSYYDLEAL